LLRYGPLRVQRLAGHRAISKYTSLEAIVKEGWSADPLERPSFEELEPALRALSMAIEQQQDEEEGESGPKRLTEVVVQRIPEEDSGRRKRKDRTCSNGGRGARGGYSSAN
jgi:hypothetical protein